jgi:hypothetical protein
MLHALWRLTREESLKNLGVVVIKVPLEDTITVESNWILSDSTKLSGKRRDPNILTVVVLSLALHSRVVKMLASVLDKSGKTN